MAITDELDTHVAGVFAQPDGSYIVDGTVTVQPTEIKGTDKKVTLPVSKDNVIFAVRSVDAAGHRSLTFVPAPQLPQR